MSNRLLSDVPAHTKKVYLPSVARSSIEAKTQYSPSNGEDNTATRADEITQSTSSGPSTTNTTGRKKGKRKGKMKLEIDYSTPVTEDEELYSSTMAPATAAEAQEDGEEDDRWDEDGAESKIPVARVGTTRGSKTGTKWDLRYTRGHTQLVDEPAEVPIKTRV